MEAQINARFEKVDARFEKVDTQFKEVGAQISNIGDRLVGMEKQLNAVDLRTGFIEKLLDIFRMSQIPPKEIKKITE
jgi:archaellum component FlaC